jgi:very-short-patch-repair endonuclease
MITRPKVLERQSRALNRERAKEMRHEPVATEELFWSRLRGRKLGGFKFKRQVLIGPYIADFVCAEHKYIVELDGPLHDAAYDAARDRYLREKGYRIMRVKNEDAVHDFINVLMAIQKELEDGAPSPQPSPSLTRGRGSE